MTVESKHVPCPELLSRTAYAITSELGDVGATQPELVPPRSAFDALMDLIGDFASGELIVFGGRPSLGKTSFVLNLIAYLAEYRQKNTLIFAPADPKERLGRRMMVSMAGVQDSKWSRGQLTEGEIQRLIAAGTMVGSWDTLIDDTPMPTLDGIRESLMRAVGMQPIHLAVLDYVQMMPRSREDRTLDEEAERIMAELKALAVDSGVPILMISQTMRRPGPIQQVPHPADAGYFDSGHTDVAMMLQIKERTPHGVPSELRVMRIPHGPDGAIGLRFDADLQRFERVPGMTGSYVIDRG